MLPSIDIVIPVYNEENYLGRCLNSLMNLDYPKNKIKVIVIDNYSNDRSVEIASGFQVTIKQVEKYSIARSRNIGVQEGNAEIIAFLDSDCVVEKGWLKQAVQHFIESGTVATGSQPLLIDDEVNLFQSTWSQLCRRNCQESHEVEWLSTQNLIVRRTAFEKLGGFNEELITCEDADLGFRLTKLGIMICDPKIIIYHLREPKNIKEFWKKEYWHSQGNFVGFFTHGIRLSELPSLVAPIIFLAGCLILIPSLVSVNLTYILVALLLMLFPIVFYSIFKYKSGMKLNLVLSIYFVYFSARAMSTLNNFFKLQKMISVIKRQRLT